VQVDDLELVCAENAYKLVHIIEKYRPKLLPLFKQRGLSALQSEERTSVEPTNRRDIMDMLKPDVRDALVASTTAKAGAEHSDKGVSKQMIYSYEVARAGAFWVGGFSFPRGLNPREWAAFRSAFYYASEGVGPMGGLLVRFGGGTSQGHGLMEVELVGQLAQGIQPRQYFHTQEMVDQERVPADMAAYAQTLSDRAGELRVALKAMM